MKVLPLLSTLNKLYRYEPDTGLLISRRFNIPVGQKHDGHLRVRIGRAHYFVHRIAWKMMTGRDPTVILDHIDGNGYNNRWSNLREVDWAQNAQNASMKSTNTSGFKGVHYCKHRKGWLGTVRYTENGARKKAYTAKFKTPEEANEAVMSLRRTIHGEFATD